MMRYRITLCSTLILALASALPAQAQTAAPSDQGRDMAAVAELRRLCEAGDADAVADKLSALTNNLNSTDTSYLVRARMFQAALRVVVESPVGKSEKVREVAADIGFAVIADTRTKGAVADPKVVQQQLEIALDILPRTSAASDSIAAMSLVLWNDMLVAEAHYSTIGSKSLAFPLPPATYKGPFIFGMDPAAISDPAFREVYAEFLAERDMRNQCSSKHQSLVYMQEHFLAKLLGLLKATYASPPEKRLVGAEVIERTVSIKSMRDKLLTAIQE